jgi:hypothetical protein
MRLLRIRKVRRAGEIDQTEVDIDRGHDGLGCRSTSDAIRSSWNSVQSSQDLGIPAIQPVPYGFRLGPWSRSDASERHLGIELVNLQQHLIDLILDDLRRLGTPLLTVRKTAGPSQSTVYSHSFIPWHPETNRPSPLEACLEASSA